MRSCIQTIRPGSNRRKLQFTCDLQTINNRQDKTISFDLIYLRSLTGTDEKTIPYL